MEKRERIGMVKAPFMVAFAGGVDVIQGVLTFLFVGLFVNWLISFFAWLTFYLWFKLSDVNFMDGRAAKSLIFVGGAFLEQLPGINALPAATLTVILTIAIVKQEDRRYNKENE